MLQIASYEPALILFNFIRLVSLVENKYCLSNLQHFSKALSKHLNLQGRRKHLLYLFNLHNIGSIIFKTI